MFDCSSLPRVNVTSSLSFSFVQIGATFKEFLQMAQAASCQGDDSEREQLYLAQVWPHSHSLPVHCCKVSSIISRFAPTS